MIAGLKRRIARLEQAHNAAAESLVPSAFRIIFVPAENGRPVPGWTPTEADELILRFPPLPTTALSSSRTSCRRARCA